MIVSSGGFVFVKMKGISRHCFSDYFLEIISMGVGLIK